MITEPLPSPYWTLPSARTFPSGAARRRAGPASRSDRLKADSYISMGRAVRSRIIGRIGVFASSADAARSVAVHARPRSPTAMHVLTMTTPLKARERIAPASPPLRGLRPRSDYPLHPAGNRWGVSGGAALA